MRRIVFVIVLLIIVCCVLALWQIRPDPPQPTPATTTLPAATSTPTPTATSPPTNTPAPTKTAYPTPTRTPEPSPAPTETPAPKPTDAILLVKTGWEDGSLHFRYGPSRSALPIWPIGWLPEGTQLIFHSCEKNEAGFWWTVVKYLDATGYVYSDYLNWDVCGVWR